MGSELDVVVPPEWFFLEDAARRALPMGIGVARGNHLMQP